jgi:alpha-ketoglutarate-dependent taurine dioxygenase
LISFKNPYLKQINVNDKSLLLSTFHKQGFVIIDGNSFKPNQSSVEDKLLHIEKTYRLGRFKASDDNVRLYNERLKESGFNNIGRPDTSVKLEHEAFDSNNGQDFHVDGIFRPTGAIKTVVLACKNKAESGGENTLFNMIGAIEHIKSIDPKLLKPLYDKRSMRRVSNYEGNDRHSLDSILDFDKEYQRTVVNFSIDKTVDWEFSEKFVPNLKKPISIIKKLAMSENEFTLEIALETGDIIMMDNSLIAHGRKGFMDNPDNPRIMVRGKYNKMPS